MDTSSKQGEEVRGGGRPGRGLLGGRGRELGLGIVNMYIKVERKLNEERRGWFSGGLIKKCDLMFGKKT